MIDTVGPNAFGFGTSHIYGFLESLIKHFHASIGGLKRMTHRLQVGSDRLVKKRTYFPCSFVPSLSCIWEQLVGQGRIVLADGCLTPAVT